MPACWCREVIYVKEGEDRDFLILDAAMNDLVRPAMYGAHHDIVPVVEPAPAPSTQPYDVVGPVCETGDTFAKGRATAAAGRGRPGGLPLRRGLRRGDGVGIQHAAPDPRSAGQAAINSPSSGPGPTFDEMIEAR